MKDSLLTLIAAFISVWLASSCKPEEQRFTSDLEAKLRFSSDTVLFDTVFTSLGSTTKRLMVYNDEPGALNVTSIRTLDTSSPYTLTVNGERGYQFENLRLLGNDSLMVLIDVLIDPSNQDLPFVVEDQLQFETNQALQSVKLIAWGQNANFLNDSILACNSTWTDERPYVIFNSLLIDSLCSLTIEPGARIFSHPGSFIFIKGTIRVIGNPQERVVFTNDRLDESFRDAPGQWEGIFFLEGSLGNQISFADIRNANTGIWLGTPDNDTIPDLVLESVKIENMARSGLLGFTSDLYAVNTLIDNCAQYCVGNFAGGNYKYVHCTFTNNSFTFFRETPLFAATDNLILADESVITADIHLEIINSIIWGDFLDEVLLNNEGGADFNLGVISSIIKTSDISFDLNNNLLNQDPLFLNTQEFDYRIDSISPAVNAGLPANIQEDLEGNPRDSIPDIGAYEWIQGNNVPL